MRKRTIILLAVPALVVAGCGGTDADVDADANSTTAAPPANFNFLGKLAIVGRDDFVYKSSQPIAEPAIQPVFEGDYCRGSSGYDDLREGAQVIVRNDSEVVGVAELSAGEVAKYPSSVVCEFRFKVADVPEGADYYGLTVGNRNELQVSVDEATSGRVALTIGE